MQLLDGKALAKTIKAEIAEAVKDITAAGKRAPHLAAVLVGEDGASRTYVNAKVKACEKVGFRSSLIKFEADVTQEKLLETVHTLNNDPEVDGFIVQLPLPDHIDEHLITLAIDPDKDVDGFHPTNLGKMLLGLDTFIPATPFGILQMIERNGIPTEGKHCVVLGRSHIVGSPMSVLMGRKGYPGNCTVTLAHSRTQDLQTTCRQADILIVALGRPEFVTADMVKDGAVVIDVGITRVEDAQAEKGYRILGDVKFDEVAEKASWITPVPGGVGAMTVTSLIMNTLKAAQKS